MSEDQMIVALILTGLSTCASALSTQVSDKVPFLGGLLRLLAINFGKAANDPEKQ